jgi:superfamily I DNA/RNA helicase
MIELDGMRTLLRMASDYGSDLDGFLDFLALGSPSDQHQPGLERVTLMTIHAAKGLEFRRVYVVGCESGLLPYDLFPDHRADIDEERRLLYVAMTRAREQLVLTHARRRRLFGRTWELPPTPFLQSVESGLLESERAELPARHDDDTGQMTLF